MCELLIPMTTDHDACGTTTDDILQVVCRRRVAAMVCRPLIVSLFVQSNLMLLDMILADRKAKQYIVRRLSNNEVAIVAPGQFDKLLARLLKLGHTPKVL